MVNKGAMGKFGVVMVLSQLSKNSIKASKMVADILLSSGKTIEVRSRQIDKDGRIHIVFHKQRQFDFLVIWVRNTDFFYIIPRGELKTKSGLSLIPGIKSSSGYHRFLNRWDILK